MEIYNVIINDRHADIEVCSFSDLEKAIKYARHIAKKYCRSPEDYQERDVKGWLFHAEYSCEGDSVTVVATELVRPTQ